jgi:hypothetical protein
MIPARRDRFNRQFSPDRYQAFLAGLRARLDVPVEFRLCETPCFLPDSLLQRLAREALAIVQKLLDDDDYLDAADEAVPERYRLARGESRPAFLQVDFGLIATGEGFEGRLVELQAFPSLYGFTPVLASAYLDTWALEGLSPFLGGLTHADYVRICGRAIRGDHDPAEVVLMEIDPLHQKTLPDFVATEQLWGVRAVNVRDVVRDGRRLCYRRDGQLVPIARVYNRVIPDDLAHSGAALQFDYRDDLDVEWAGGPDWFFRISKFSLPWLDHPWVPETHYLDEVGSPPGDREAWVLKPLFSFAGGGVVFAPTDGDLAKIPSARRHDYVLQRRVDFTPVIATPYGATKAEVRIMLVDDGGVYRAVAPLIRMGRGKMMGVDHNKGMPWVGASAGLVDASV